MVAYHKTNARKIMFDKSSKENPSQNKPPLVYRDSPLLNRLIVITLIGFDEALNEIGPQYLRLLCRLTDKAFDDYYEAKYLIEKEINTGDKLEYRFKIIGCLEDCIYSINRAIRIINILIEGKNITKKLMDTYPRLKNEKIGSVFKIKCNFLNFANPKTLENIKRHRIFIRNRIEHIDEDVYFSNSKFPVFLDIDEKYEKIFLNKQELKFQDLASIIKDYHEFMLEIINNMPKKNENGIFHYENKK